MEQDKGQGMEYPQNPIDAFANSCILDLRVRLAIDFLKSPMFARTATGASGHGQAVWDAAPKHMVELALRVASEIIEQGKAKGWVAPLPEGDEVDERMRAHARRQARFTIFQNISANNIAQEMAPGVVPAAPGFPGKPRGH